MSSNPFLGIELQLPKMWNQICFVESAFKQWFDIERNNQQQIPASTLMGIVDGLESSIALIADRMEKIRLGKSESAAKKFRSVISDVTVHGRPLWMQLNDRGNDPAYEEFRETVLNAAVKYKEAWKEYFKSLQGAQKSEFRRIRQQCQLHINAYPGLNYL